MAAGDVSVDLNWNPDVFDDLTVLIDGKLRPRNLYMAVLDADDALVYPPFVLRRVEGGKDGLRIGGPGVLWEWGSNGIGPTIDDRSYYSGVSVLDDGGFELGNLLYWKRSEGSTWTTGSDPHSGALSAFHSADTDTDDPLANDRTYPAEAGQEWTATAWVARGSGSFGRIHLRLAFGGRFAPYDALVHDWTNTSEFPADMDETSPGVFRVGPNERKQIMLNGGFETGTMANWSELSGSWGPTTTNPRSGSWSADIGGTSPAVFREIVSDAVDGGLVQGYGITPGESYVIEAFVDPGATADGKAWMSVRLGGVVGGVPNTPILQAPSTKLENNTSTGASYNRLSVEVDVPTDAVLPYFLVGLITEEQENGNWYFDDVSVTRTKGNRGYLAGNTPWFFIPLRTYKWSAHVETAELISGSMRFGLTLFGVGRPNIYIESQPFDTRSLDGLFEWEFTPPSGYQAGAPVIISDDIYGGYFVVTDMHCFDQDTSTMVVDTDSAVSGGWAQLTRAFVAPVGTDSVHVEVVPESGGGGWVVDDVTLTRTSVPISTGDDVVADLFIHPTTGLPMSIEAGTISCPETIPYDWRQILLTNRAALDQFCSVVSIPTREYRVTAALPPLLDVAETSVLWPDPGLASAYLADDLKVLELSPPSTDVADRPTDIRLIGNEVPLLSGQTRLITATAPVPGPVELDLQGNPVVRTSIVNDATVDHQGYAVARAEDLAAEAADPTWAAKVVITGSGDRLQAGETIYIFKPDAGLVGLVGVSIEGQTVFPKRGRVLEFQREHGPSFRVVMLTPGGAQWDLPGVLSSEADKLEITVGNRMPVEWTSDPQGGAAGKQYLEDRKSRPR